MFDNTKALFLLCETPLHAGSGSDLGVVDLPIQRERHTGFPKIEASSLKGALRQAFDKAATDKSDIDYLFGKEDSQALHAGALAFTDARLLFFPIKSLKGIFAWVTCPRILCQWCRDTGEDKDIFSNLTIADGKFALIADTKKSKVVVNEKYIVLEQYTFEIESSPIDEKLKTKLNALFQNKDKETFWREQFLNNIVILNDNDFSDFVQLSTEVITRIKIDNETGTVVDGQLFTEEYLPAESILYSLVFESNRVGNSNGAMDKFQTQISSLPLIQIGGNATLGKGIVRTQLLEPSKIVTENAKQ